MLYNVRILLKKQKKKFKTEKQMIVIKKQIKLLILLKVLLRLSKLRNVLKKRFSLQFYYIRRHYHYWYDT